MYEMSIAYAVMLVISIVLLVGYCFIVRKKDFWLLSLFISVAVVNLGYFMLSRSKTVEFALFSNKIAYLGSIFLLMCMLMAIVKLCGIRYKKALPTILFLAGLIMFGIVCTSGYLPWYYKETSLIFVDGAAKLKKIYGFLHPSYLIYVLLYFVSMVVCIIDSLRRKIFASQKQAALMASVVFGNIAVWFVEKFVPWDFEFLAVSYLFSEIILLAVHWMMQDYVHINQTSHASLENTVEVFDIQTASIEQKVSKIVLSLSEEEELSSREREMLELILQNKKRKDIADELHLSENTVKTHTRTLYAKLGVGSRDELNELLQK
jgi:DNA-binding CsgD family transcriptional regulator